MFWHFALFCSNHYLLLFDADQTFSPAFFRSLQVVSILRLKHNIKAEVCQLTSCDYIVSNRMAVKRKSVSGELIDF